MDRIFIACIHHLTSPSNFHKMRVEFGKKECCYFENSGNLADKGDEPYIYQLTI